MFVRIVTLAALTTLTPAQSTPAQSTQTQSAQTSATSIEDLLPASTYAALRFGGLKACRVATSQMPVTALVTEMVSQMSAEARARLFEHPLEEAAADFRGSLQAGGFNPSDCRAVLDQPMAMAIGRLSIEGQGPSLCLVIEEGEHRDAIDRSVSAMFQLIRRDSASASVKQIKIAGRPFYHLLVDGMPIFAGSIAGHYCVSNSRGYLREVLAVAAGEQPGLARATAVGELRQQSPTPPLAACTINTRSVMDALAPHLPYEAGDFSDALGLGRLDLIYGALCAGEGGGDDRLYVGVDGAVRGLAKGLVAAPVDLGFAKACSYNTVIFGATSFDVPAVIDAFRRFADLLPEQVRSEMEREMMRGMMRGFRAAGTSPAAVEASLRAFGNQIGFALSLEKGLIPKPVGLVHVSVKDASVVSSVLRRFEARSAQDDGLEWRSRKVGQQEIRFCNVTVGDGFQLSPCYALSDDSLWLATDVASLVRAIKRAASGGESLADAEDFQALQEASAGANGALHLRLSRAVELGWRTVETIGFPKIDAQSDELGFDSSILPDGDDLAEALGTTSLIYGVDQAGISVKAEGLLTLGTWWATMGTIFDAVMSRTTGKIF